MQPDLNSQLYDAIIDENIEAISTLIQQDAELDPSLISSTGLDDAAQAQFDKDKIKLLESFYSLFRVRSEKRFTEYFKDCYTQSDILKPQLNFTDKRKLDILLGCCNKKVFSTLRKNARQLAVINTVSRDGDRDALASKLDILRNVVRDHQFETLHKDCEDLLHFLSSYPNLDYLKEIKVLRTGKHPKAPEGGLSADDKPSKEITLEMALKLCSLHIAALNKDGCKGYTPLHWAARKGKTEVVKLLLEHGANVNAKDRFGNTPLHLAAWKGKTEVVDLLLTNGADINAKNNDGETPLHWAACNGHTEVVELLLERDADTEAKNEYGTTPLHLAADRGHTEVVELLLQHRANIHEKDQYGHTPLHWAARKGKTEVVKLLLEHGANPYARINNGKTPRALALDYGHTQCANLLPHFWLKAVIAALSVAAAALIYLVSNGLRPGYYSRYYPLHDACWYGSTAVVELLLKNGADIDKKNEYGTTPLHLAADRGHTEVVELLLQHRANIHEKDQYGHTPLHWATAEGHNKVVRLLLRHRADINAENNIGETPLHLAVRYGKTEIVELLLKNGANINAITICGDTPLQLAKSKNHTEIIQLLESAVQKAPDQLGASALAQASADLEGRGTTGAAEAGNTTGAAAEEGKGEELGDIAPESELAQEEEYTQCADLLPRSWVKPAIAAFSVAAAALIYWGSNRFHS